MKNKYRILKILLTVGGLMILLNFSLKRFDSQLIQGVFVDMNQETPVYFIDKKEVIDLIKKENPSRKIGDIDVPDLEYLLKNKLPAVDSLNVYLTLNGNLNVSIKQKIPAFRLNKIGREFYVDEKGNEFSLSKNYAYPCMLITGDLQKKEYKKLIRLVKKIDADPFMKAFFIGISKRVDQNYDLLTHEGIYRVELGSLDNIDFKINGFRAFVEKYLIFQEPTRYKKISMKYHNQIVTTLNKDFLDYGNSYKKMKNESSSSQKRAERKIENILSKKSD